ncbi:MAG: hydantoinase/oxoprolinase family protein [Acidobacteriota bacterium]
MLRIGIDTGGTFTDFVVLEQGQFSSFKLPSTPARPEEALLEGLSRITREGKGFLVQHGSTVATNALLERKGARTLLLTNQGFEDVLEIGRQNRPKLYQLSSSRPQPLVPSALRIGVKERTLWDGTVLVPLEEQSLEWLRNKVEQLAPESIAVTLLYSYVNPDSERRILKALESLEVPISLSHRVLPEFREYERTSATVLNAYLTPVMSRYLDALSSEALVREARLTVMQSNGGTLSARSAAEEPVRTLFSGPAGGVVGAFELAREAGYDRIITFDMGGTSTDVCLCDGRISRTKEASIGGYPVPVQMIGIHSVGAGGGSIAWVDPGGLLRVGPQSAGAEPGPVCYGKGEEPTVTDANVFLGMLDPDWFLGGEYPLWPEKIRPALERVGGQLQEVTDRSWQPDEMAEGIRRIVNTQMERALRVISLERGYDTRDFTLVSFGGAGGLHACHLARSLLIRRVLVPAHPGLLSALGILRSDVMKETSLTVMLHSRNEGLDQRLRETFLPLEKQVGGQLSEEGFGPQEMRIQKSVDARYAGQSHELNVPLRKDFLKDFHRLHHQFYGYSNSQLPVEIVNLRVMGSGRLPGVALERFPLEGEEAGEGAIVREKSVLMDGQAVPTRFYARNQLRPGNRFPGPAVVLEYSSTTLVPPDFRVSVDEWLNLIVEPLSASPA